jgi:putative colanic acid biosynthesis acetyltransferase WcaF
MVNDQPQLTSDALGSRLVSPWSLRQKLLRSIWYFVEATIFRFSPRPLYRWRNLLLRCFGANVDRSCRIRSTVSIENPWHLTIGADTIIGDYVHLYCLGIIKIGRRVTISQFGHLCAGTHDCTRADFPLICLPISVGDDVWLAADVFVGPGAKIGNGVVVGARSSVFSDLPPWQICVGTPAQPIKDRKLAT